MNKNALLSDQHSQIFRNILKENKDELPEKKLVDIFGMSQPTISRLINGKHKASYVHVGQLIKALGDNKNKLLRHMLAEHLIDKFSAELPKLNDYSSLPILRKVNLDRPSIARLTKYLAKSYLEDFEDIGLSENIIAPHDMDNQSLEYVEGYLSALVYLLFLIEGVIYSVELYKFSQFYTNNYSMLLWFIEVMGAFNKKQRQTAFDNDNSTEYDKDVFNEQWAISVIESSKDLYLQIQQELLRFCPIKQSKLFYVGWNSFCVLFSDNFITTTDEKPLSYLINNKYMLLDSLSYCLDKFLERNSDSDHKLWKEAYDFLVLELKMEGYEEAEKKLANECKSFFKYWYKDDVKNNIENILLCFDNKVKGTQVAANLLFSYIIEHRTAPPAPLSLWRDLADIMEDMKKYFGTEEIAIRQIKKLTVDQLICIDLKSAKSILHNYRHRNKLKRQGKHTEKIEAILFDLTHNPCGNSLADKLVDLSQKYEISVDKLPSRDDFLREFSKLYSVYSRNETSRKLYKKYGLELDDILHFMEYYSYWDESQENCDKIFINKCVEMDKTRLANKTPPKSLAAMVTFNNEKEFYDFIVSSWDIIDFFSDQCEETDAEFLRLYLKVKS